MKTTKHKFFWGKVPRRIPGVMNKTEERYFKNYILPEMEKGEIIDARYEEFTLKLAPSTTYTPDFWVQFKDGSAMFIEVKGGFTRDDARVKFKVAAEKFRAFRFKMVQLKNGVVIKEEEPIHE